MTNESPLEPGRSTPAPGAARDAGVEIAFRALERSDLERVHTWLNEPDVARWYSSGAPTRDAVRRKYVPRIEGRSPTHVYVARAGACDAGLAQTYRIADYPKLAAALGAGAGWGGLDYFIGEPDLRGRRLAHRVIARFAVEVVAALPGIDVCASLPACDNIKSVRALERAGFRTLEHVEIEPGQIDALMIRELGARQPCISSSSA